MQTKICSSCKTDKSIDLFPTSTRYVDGHKSQCKDCHNTGRQNSHLKKRTEFILQQGGSCQKCNQNNLELLGFKNTKTKKFNTLTSSSNAGLKMQEILDAPQENILLCVVCKTK